MTYGLLLLIYALACLRVCVVMPWPCQALTSLEILPYANGPVMYTSRAVVK